MSWTGKKSVKSVVCQTEVTWVSSDTPVRTVSSICVSGSPGLVSTGIQAFSGKSGPASADARALCESMLKADKSSGFPGAGPSAFLQAPDFDPGDWVKVQFWAQRPDRWRQVEDLCSQAQLKNPVASRPSAKATRTSKKKVSGGRKPKGQDGPIKTFNRVESLEGDTGMEVEASQMSLPSSFLQVMADIVQWNVRGLRANFEELRLFL